MNDFDTEKQHFCEKYDVKIMTEQKLMLYHQGIGQTWNPTNPEHHNTCKSFAIYAAKLCN